MKKLLVLIAASMTSSMVLYTLVSMDQPARHPALGATELPPLIAVHDFYGASGGKADNDVATPATEIAWPSRNCPERTNTGRLTLPQTKSPTGPLPAVILIDNGATAEFWPVGRRDSRFLANRGYAVLSIDCLGMSKSDTAIADNAVHRSSKCSETDIADGARQLVDQGIADPASLAIIGARAGGYAAVRTISSEPGLFKAAIVHSPVIDQSDADNLRPVAAQACLDENTATYTGSVDDGMVNGMPGAVLLIHGEAGTGNTGSSSRDLLNAGRGVEVIHFSPEESNRGHWQTRVQIARLAESFLARHLGGRNGGYDYIELWAKLF